jgi:hypothetical protein
MRQVWDYGLRMRRDSFERFYYEKIALAEGCGCAEHVTRMRDIDALATMQRATALRFASIGAIRKAATAAFVRLRDRLAYRPGLRSSRI